jgi:hypothetical protein
LTSLHSSHRCDLLSGLMAFRRQQRADIDGWRETGRQEVPCESAA